MSPDETTVSRLPRVILVEDDDVDALILERSMRRLDLSFELIRTRDGLEALTYLENRIEHRPELVILDLNLPRMNGLQFLDAIRADERLRDLTVFVLSTSTDVRDVEEAYRNQVAGYFVKELNQESVAKFLSFIEEYLRLSVRPPTERGHVAHEMQHDE